ncbi:hypothetical protein B0H17DRAFT_897528, partial [Mycena rosella]
CPPPSRIFHGRQAILNQMGQYFESHIGYQHIFLLHELGGAGKTQIGLKFIADSLSRRVVFSDIFLIDASTIETIDMGYKNVAVSKHAGNTLQEALRWLVSMHHDWLLLFDNADDPAINLNKFLPQCDHGNILITSRNPGLSVYAGAHSPVSDMEKSDAVELLLRCAVQHSTSRNREIAGDIELSYFPLAIIQAGTFISKSGNLNSYSALYNRNRMRLLSEQLSQSHDNYAWTVYTTWQISFERLSHSAAKLLQLWSFLHHQGISEQMFSIASTYRFTSHGPLEQELRRALQSLIEFGGPSGVWDSLHFMDLTNELRAYSLINFDAETTMFSIHPLVHNWTRSTLSDPEAYRACMLAIVGMSLASIAHENQLPTCLGLLPHAESLLQGETRVTPDFNAEYGMIYGFSGRHREAEKFFCVALKHRKQVLGADHPLTLMSMGQLASSYQQLGRLKEAEEIELTVREQWKKLLGDEHPQTLYAMSNLGVTWHHLSRLQEAEELETLALQLCKKVLGEVHPHTLRAASNLAATYHMLGRLKEAEELDREVLQRRQAILGEHHPEALRNMGNLAATYRKLGKLKEAEELQLTV